MLRRLYDRTLAAAASPRALPLLFLLAFVEASVFPIPVEAMMIPMVLAAPRRWLVIGVIASAGTVLGAVAGYAIGALAFEQIGRPVLAALGKAEAMAEFNTRFNDLGFWPVLIGALTPFPFKVITIMSGWTGLPFATFLGASLVARTARFLLTCWLLRLFGAPVRALIERRLGLMFTLFLAILIGGFYLVRFL